MQKKLIIFLAGVIICLGFAWYWYNKPREGVASKSTDASVRALQLYEAFNNNEAEANKIYLNKVIEVKGMVDDLANSGEEIILTLGLQPTGGGISCRFSPGKEVVEKNITKGQEITVKGRCTGFNIDVNLTDCVIAK
ncbi:MAG: hypothetical protein IT249_07415 [Chitinophagaceae bacterium]|nr:hypothetical protein [Chitinophagaceae bacterium]